jgi:hypothetical protein
VATRPSWAAEQAYTQQPLQVRWRMPSNDVFDFDPAK